MSVCTAPVKGHRDTSATAQCPACAPTQTAVKAMASPVSRNGREMPAHSPVPGMTRWKYVGQDVDRELAEFATVSTEFTSEDRATGLQLLHSLSSEIRQTDEGRYYVKSYRTWFLNDGRKQLPLRSDSGRVADPVIEEHADDVAGSSEGLFPTVADAIAGARASGEQLEPTTPQTDLLLTSVAYYRNLRRLGIDPTNEAAVAYLERNGDMSQMSAHHPAVALALSVHRNPA